MDFSLKRILNEINLYCKWSKHSEITKMLTLSSYNEPFVDKAFDRRCSICINMFLWQTNFDKVIVSRSKQLSQEYRDDLLLRIEFFADNQEHIKTLLDAFREERFEMLKSLFCSNDSTVRNFAYQLALERELKEDKSDVLLLLLQWEKEQLEENFDAHKLSAEIDPDLDPHRHVVSKLGKFMLRFDFSDPEPQKKRIKLDHNVPWMSVSMIYERLKLDESVITKKWFERKGQTLGVFGEDLEPKLLQIHREDLNSYYAYFLLNDLSLIDVLDIENASSGQSFLEYLLRNPDDFEISVEILRNFVKAKPSVVNWIKEETGDSILHVFIKTRIDTPEIVRFMVEELGLDPLQENKAKENALEAFLRAIWSDNWVYEPIEAEEEILEYLEAKSPLNGTEFIQKFSIFTGFLMVFQVAFYWITEQNFFLEYAMEKFYGPEVNQDYPLVERFKKFYGPNLYETSTHIGYNYDNFYDVVALLHSDFDQDHSNRLKSNPYLDTVLQENEKILSFIDGGKCDQIAKFYDESDEVLKLFFEIIMKIEMIYTRFSRFQTAPKILSCFPPYDGDSKEGFKEKHIERMIRVFNELISEKNKACATIQEAIEKWSVKNIIKDFFKFYYNDPSDSDSDSDQDIEEEHHRFLKKIFESGLFSALYSFTCDWKFTLRDEDDLSDHYEEMKMFLGKCELFIPGSLYPQKREVFSLKHLCRLEIRQMLIKDGPRDIVTYVEMIESLGLPTKMENYIRYLPECSEKE